MKPKSDPPRTQIAEHVGQKQLGDFDRSPSRRPTITDWFLVLFTAALVISSFLQWQATRDAISDARQSFKLGNRAYLVPKDANIHQTRPQGGGVVITKRPAPKLTETPALEVTLVNGGRTPAINVSTIAFFQVRDDLVSNTPTYPSVDEKQKTVTSVTLVAPDAVVVPRAAFHLTKDEFTAIWEGRKKLTIYGFANYEDVFGERHGVKWCYWYYKDDLVPCPTHNAME